MSSLDTTGGSYGAGSTAGASYGAGAGAGVAVGVDEAQPTRSRDATDKVAIVVSVLVVLFISLYHLSCSFVSLRRVRTSCSSSHTPCCVSRTTVVRRLEGLCQDWTFSLSVSSLRLQSHLQTCSDTCCLPRTALTKLLK